MSLPSSSQEQRSPGEQGDPGAADDDTKMKMTMMIRREGDERVIQQLCDAMGMAYRPTKVPSSSVDWTKMTQHVTSSSLSIREQQQHVRLLGRLLRQNHHWIAIKIWLPCLLLLALPNVVVATDRNGGGDDDDGDDETTTTMTSAIDDYCASLMENSCLQKLVLEHPKTSRNDNQDDHENDDDGMSASVTLQIVTRLVVAFSQNNYEAKEGQLKHIVFNNIELAPADADADAAAAAAAAHGGTPKAKLQQALQTIRLGSVVLHHCNVEFTLLVLKCLYHHKTLQMLEWMVEPTMTATTPMWDTLSRLVNSVPSLKCLQIEHFDVRHLTDAVSQVFLTGQYHQVHSFLFPRPFCLLLGQRPRRSISLQCLFPSTDNMELPPPPIPLGFQGLWMERNIQGCLHLFLWHVPLWYTGSIWDVLIRDEKLHSLRLSFMETIDPDSIARMGDLLRINPNVRHFHLSTRANLDLTWLTTVLPRTQLSSIRLTTGFALWQDDGDDDDDDDDDVDDEGENINNTTSLFAAIGQCTTLRDLSLEIPRLTSDQMKKLLHHLTRWTHIERISFPWLQEEGEDNDCCCFSTQLLETLRDCPHLLHVHVRGLPSEKTLAVRLAVHRHRLLGLLQRTDTPMAVWPRVLERRRRRRLLYKPPSTLFATIQVLAGKMEWTSRMRTAACGKMSK